MAKLFAVCFELQRDQISAWCWGSCGKGLVGAVDLGFATAIACRETSCPHLDREMDELMGEVGGEPVCLRKLTELGSSDPSAFGHSFRTSERNHA